LNSEDGSTKNDVRLPEGDLGEKILADFDEGRGKDVYVSITRAMKEEACLGYRVVGE
jgi:translation initiation factor 5A